MGGIEDVMGRDLKKEWSAACSGCGKALGPTDPHRYVDGDRAGDSFYCEGCCARQIARLREQIRGITSELRASRAKCARETARRIHDS